MIPTIKIDDFLLKYSRRYNFDLEKEVASAFEEVQKRTSKTLSEISILPSMSIFSRFDANNNSLNISLYPGFLKPFRGEESRRLSMRYILEHELQEALENKPDMIKIASDKIFSAILPSFDSNSPLIEMDRTQEDLILHSKNTCVDVKLDRKLVLNEEDAKGFLITHDVFYRKRKLELMKLKIYNGVSGISSNMNPYDLVYLLLSASRGAVVAKSLKKKKMGAYGCFASNLRTQFFGLTDSLRSLSKYAFGIYNELVGEEPQWQNVYENANEIIKGLFYFTIIVPSAK